MAEALQAGRWAVNFEQQILADGIRFFHEHEGLVSFEDTSDVTIQSRTGFRFKL